MKQSSQDPDSLDDVESSLMECDPQDKQEYSDEKLFKVFATNVCFVKYCFFKLVMQDLSTTKRIYRGFFKYSRQSRV